MTMNASETANLRAAAASIKQAAGPGAMSYEEAVLVASGRAPAPPAAPLPFAEIVERSTNDQLHARVVSQLAAQGLSDPRQPGYRNAYRRALADITNAQSTAVHAAEQQRVAASERAHQGNADILLRAGELRRTLPTEGDESEYSLLRRALQQAGAERTARERGR